MRVSILVFLFGVGVLGAAAEECTHEQPEEEKLSHVDFFDRAGMPNERWDIRPRTGFGVESAGELNAVGYHGPNTLGASSPLQDIEFSFWFRYRDLRTLAEIPDGEQEFDVVLRRDEDATALVWLRLAPMGLRLMSTDGAETTTLAIAGSVFAPDALIHLDTLGLQFDPGAWYNLRIRIVGKQARVWLRNDAGEWDAPVLSVPELPHEFTSTAYGFTAHPTARYRLANFRMRAYDGEIDTAIDEIDGQELLIGIPEGSGTVRPAAGHYPLEEIVPVSVTPAPGFIFEGWANKGADALHGPNTTNTWIRMDP